MGAAMCFTEFTHGFAVVVEEHLAFGARLAVAVGMEGDDVFFIGDAVFDHLLERRPDILRADGDVGVRQDASDGVVRLSCQFDEFDEPWRVAPPLPPVLFLEEEIGGFVPDFECVDFVFEILGHEGGPSCESVRIEGIFVDRIVVIANVIETYPTFVQAVDEVVDVFGDDVFAFFLFNGTPAEFFADDADSGGGENVDETEVAIPPAMAAVEACSNPWAGLRIMGGEPPEPCGIRRFIRWVTGVYDVDFQLEGPELVLQFFRCDVEDEIFV